MESKAAVKKWQTLTASFARKMTRDTWLEQTTLSVTDCTLSDKVQAGIYCLLSIWNEIMALVKLDTEGKKVKILLTLVQNAKSTCFIAGFF